MLPVRALSAAVLCRMVLDTLPLWKGPLAWLTAVAEEHQDLDLWAGRVLWPTRGHGRAVVEVRAEAADGIAKCAWQTGATGAHLYAMAAVLGAAPMQQGATTSRGILGRGPSRRGHPT